MDTITLNAPGGLTLTLLLTSLRPLVAEVVRESLVAANTNERIGYSERDAAKLIGCPKTTLRDARCRGLIAARKVGNTWTYSMRSLQRFLDGLNPDGN